MPVPLVRMVHGLRWCGFNFSTVYSKKVPATQYLAINAFALIHQIDNKVWLLAFLKRYDSSSGGNNESLHDKSNVENKIFKTKWICTIVKLHAGITSPDRRTFLQFNIFQNSVLHWISTDSQFKNPVRTCAVFCLKLFFWSYSLGLITRSPVNNWIRVFSYYQIFSMAGTSCPADKKIWLPNKIIWMSAGTLAPVRGQLLIF